MTTLWYVSSETQLNSYITMLVGESPGPYTIYLDNSITETANLDPIVLPSGVTLLIDGSNGSGGIYTLDGSGNYTGVSVAAGSAVTLENLQLSDLTSTLAGGELVGTVTIASSATLNQTSQIEFGDATNGAATVSNFGTYDIEGVFNITGVTGSQFINNGLFEETGVDGFRDIDVNVKDTGTLSTVDVGSHLLFNGTTNSFGTTSGFSIDTGGMIDYGSDSTDALYNVDMQNSACTSNMGTVDQYGELMLSSGSTIANGLSSPSTAIWDFTSDSSIEPEDQNNIGDAFFTNYGILEKTGGTGTSYLFIPYDEAYGLAYGTGGSIIIDTGTLAFNGPNGIFEDTISGAGTFSLGGGGSDAINADFVYDIATGAHNNVSTISSGGWTITDTNTVVTLNEVLTYSGNFTEQSGATLTLTSNNNLTLQGPATFINANVDGLGNIETSGTTNANGLTLASGVQWQNVGAATLGASGTLTVSDLTGSGSVTLDSGSTLNALGTVGAGETIALAANNAVVTIGALSEFLGTISGFAAGDVLKIEGSLGIKTATPTYDLDITSLALKNSSGMVVGTLSLTGNYSGDSFSVTSDTVISGTADIAICFMAGTMIRTPRGDTAIETLKRGDHVLNPNGRSLLVTWIGLQTIATRFADPLGCLPIRIKAGALGDEVPSRDLVLSPGHAILVGGALIQAGALVNGISIVREKNVPEMFTYYHIETEHHSLILAENAAAETFVDNAGRFAFDNWPEHQALYPEGKPIVEMSYPRAKSYRQVPRVIRDSLIDRGIALYGNKMAAAS